MEKQLHALRLQEFKNIFEKLKLDTTNSSVLEIGSGTGYQLELLQSIFGRAFGIEIEDSTYAKYRSDKVRLYDGHRIPFDDNTFDYIFSSNVLEHIPHLEEISNEFKRVLKPGGRCIHVMPTHTWKFWSTLTHYVAFVPRGLVKEFKKRLGKDSTDSQRPVRIKSTRARIYNMLYPERHGERGNKYNEIFYFRPQWWIKHFKANGWEVESEFPVGVFYTGNSAFGENMGMNTRKTLSRFLGSSCHAFLVRPAGYDTHKIHTR
jgi:SAM-dependent methyltransferase